MTTTASTIWHMFNPKETTPPTKDELAQAQLFIDQANKTMTQAKKDIDKLRRANVSNP